MDEKTTKEIKKRFNPKVEYIYFTKPDMKINYFNRKKIPYLIYHTSESTMIITELTKYRFVHGKNFPPKKINLFRMVKTDARQWLKENQKYNLPKRVRTEKTNEFNTDKNIVGCDINHAYWRIAYIHGIISEATYKYGLDDNCKALRLATISILGRKKEFSYFENGKKIDTVIIQKPNEKRRKIYDYCRYFCYLIMHEISEMLGKDFDAYKIDCVYFTDTPENRQKVGEFLDSHNLTYKWLTEFEPDDDEEE